MTFCWGRLYCLHHFPTHLQRNACCEQQTITVNLSSHGAAHVPLVIVIVVAHYHPEIIVRNELQTFLSSKLHHGSPVSGFIDGHHSGEDPVIMARNFGRAL
jgi:hypothetical protein